MDYQPVSPELKAYVEGKSKGKQLAQGLYALTFMGTFFGVIAVLICLAVAGLGFGAIKAAEAWDRHGQQIKDAIPEMPVSVQIHVEYKREGE